MKTIFSALLSELGYALSFRLATIFIYLSVAVPWLPTFAQSKPNVILITADDLGLHLGCYGDSIARTPHLDQLAQEGLQFTNAYVTQASCSPSRSSIFTGLYPHQNGQVGLAHIGFTMLEGIPNLVQTLKDNDYRTGIIGKLHVQPESEFPFDYKKIEARPTRKVRQVSEQLKEFIQAGEDPFFVSLNYFDPHVKFFSQVEGIPEKPFLSEEVNSFPFQLVDTAPQLERIAGYYNGVARLDAGIGLVREMLADIGQLDNTIILFVSDHGAPFARGKTANYESSVKVPMIIRYPNLVSANSQSSALVSTVDIFPTLLEMCQSEIDYQIAGKSLVPLLDNANDDDFREYLFSEFTFHGGRNGFFPRRAVRGQQYKLIHNLNPEADNPNIRIDGDSDYFYALRPQYEGTLTQTLFERLAKPPEYELYDLTNDPHEYENLAKDPAHQATLRGLQSVLYEWRKATHDPLLYDYWWERFTFQPNEQ
ncbi:MAG: sulfatase [Bacteroidota bacterium]